MVDVMLFLPVRFSMEYMLTVSQRSLYSDFIYLPFSTPPQRCFPPQNLGHDTLKRVRKMSVQPTTKTFIFKPRTNTLTIKIWLDDRGIVAPWASNCRLRNQPKTIEHRFISCNDAFIFWDVLQQTLQKDIYITLFFTRSLLVHHGETIPYDIFVLTGSLNLWRCRTIGRNGDLHRTTRSQFKKTVAQVRDVYQYRCQFPDWRAFLSKYI